MLVYIYNSVLIKSIIYEAQNKDKAKLYKYANFLAKKIKQYTHNNKNK